MRLSVKFNICTISIFSADPFIIYKDLGYYFFFLIFWNKTQKMGSLKHGIKIEIKEPKDFHNIKSFIAYPLSYLGKTTIGTLPEWTKYDVIFNTCLWLSVKHQTNGGISKQVRAFQPSRSLSAIMNKVSIDSQYFHLETMLQNKFALRSLYKSPECGRH